MSTDTKEKSAVRAAGRTSHARDYGPGFFVKLGLMAAIDALGVYGLLVSWKAGSTGIFWALVALLLVANYVYFSKRAIAAKYIFPGLAFLLVFQIYVVAYTVVVSFTNYGDGHNSTKEQAITSLLQQNERRVEGTAAYPIAVVKNGDTLGFAVLEDGKVKVGSAEDPLHATEATVEGDKIKAVDGWDVLAYKDVLADQKAVTSLRVPVSDDPNDGSIRTQDARVGHVYLPAMTYDEKADTMTDTVSGKVYTPNKTGQFEAEDGSTLEVGWRVGVGVKNYTTALTDSRYATPFVKVLLWTIAFAFITVASCFLLGFFLAIALNEDRLKGRKFMRTVLILPYAIPGFLGILVWTGLLNRGFGFVNQVLLGGAEIGWLTDPWLAKFSVLFVNLWLGFPYMFLICTGALQGMSTDILEAATIDGAGKWRTWRSIIMPLVLIATAPLLISSFAFNFNNFNLIYMLTGGGPRFADASVPIGHTDILISMVYSISGLDGSAQKDYGLASALSIVIFLIVGTVSAIAFRQTRKIEEMI